MRYEFLPEVTLYLLGQYTEFILPIWLFSEIYTT